MPIAKIFLSRYDLKKDKGNISFLNKVTVNFGSHFEFTKSATALSRNKVIISTQRALCNDHCSTFSTLFYFLLLIVLLFKIMWLIFHSPYNFFNAFFKRFFSKILT